LARTFPAMTHCAIDSAWVSDQTPWVEDVLPGNLVGK